MPKVLRPSAKYFKAYYKITRKERPSSLLVKAVKYVKKPGNALDIGAGGLKDTRFLLKKGFQVTAIDEQPSVAKAAKKIEGPINVIISRFAKARFPKGQIALASAIYSLPFNPRRSFPRLLQRIQRSLVKGGVFCANFFGKNGEKDRWIIPSKKMTFTSKSEIRQLMKGMTLIHFREREFKAKPAIGKKTRWHVIEIIARKKKR